MVNWPLSCIRGEEPTITEEDSGAYLDEADG